METRQLVRPLGNLSLTATTTTARVLGGCRHQSTTARTKKMLKIPPHPDFLTPNEGQSHVIFNPPAAAPSVYHTPFKFLPTSDPRRQANLTQLLRSVPSSSALASFATASSPSSSNGTLPPAATKSDLRTRKYNVTREQVDEIRRLRAEDPTTWSVHKLAERFECSPYFIMMTCSASREHQSQERERREAIRARWGPIRTAAREERKKRKQLLLKGLL
ncbi:hypothetical protein F5Y15DRAFT_327171 [Xylariaceae sp. FL0016]|nr:hypothetical protein F5Y15DRAFT_327171 [Xylariaceae sp. FL0016]